MKMMKKLMAMCAVLFAVFCVQAATETVNGVKWTYFVELGRATVGGSGPYPSTAVSTSISGAITIPETLGGYPVECIGYNAFYGCANLTSVKIPNRVWGFGDRAFKGCKGLADSDGFVIVNGNLYDYFGENKNVIIPDGVHCIRKEAFADCSFIVDITVPNSVKSISQNAFAGCDMIRKATLPAWKCGINFSNITNLIISEGSENIGSGAFSNCDALQSVVIPSTVTNIGAFAFKNCSSLVKVTIPSSVVSVGNSAFEGCNKSLYDEKTILGVRIVDGWIIYSDKSVHGDLDLSGTRGICCSVFEDCIGIKSVMIGNRVVNIDDYTFKGCSGLECVTIPNSVSKIGRDAFFRCASLTNVYCGAELIEEGAFEECSNLVNITFSDRLKNIGPFALGSCLRLSQLTIPSSVTNIASSALYWCTNLVKVAIENGNRHYSVNDRILYTENGQCLVWCPSDKMRVVIPDGVTCISDHAFCGCVNLESVFIPDSVSTIVPWYEDWYREDVCDDDHYSDWPCFSCQGFVGVIADSRVDFYNIRGPLSYETMIEEWNANGGASSSSVQILEDGLHTPGRHQVSFICSRGSGKWSFDDCADIYIYHSRYRAFSGCSNIKEVRIPMNLLPEISMQELYSDSYTSITNITLTGNSAEIPDYAFDGFSALTSVTIPNGVTSIGDCAFFDCSSLTHVTIPKSVTSIGYYAFGCCSELTSVTIPDGVTSIEDRTFWRCSSLTSITVPNGVTNIGDCAFFDCSGLKQAFVPESLRAQVNQNKVFSGCSNVKVIYYGSDYGFSIANVELSFDKCIYSGERKCPLVRKTVNVVTGEEYREGVDFEVYYENNVERGQGTVVLKGIGIHSGKECRKKFAIEPKALTASMIGTVADTIYSGSAQTPSPVVVDAERGVTLVLGKDYKLSYSNNKNVGTASVTVTGMGNYSDSVSRNFLISQRSISDATITLGSALVYNGKSQTQTISGVKVDGLDVSYTVVGNSATEAGIYTMTLTGTGNFIGTVTKQYSIGKCNISGADVTLGSALTYNGKSQSQTISSVKVGDLNVTYNVIGNSAIEAGVHTMTLTGTGNFAGTATKQFVIVPKVLVVSMVGAASDVVYNGSAFTPSPFVVDAERGVTLVSDMDYTLSYSNNKNVGTATVTVTGIGNYSGSVSKTFTIAKAEVTPPVLAVKPYTGNPQTATVPDSPLYRVVQNIPQTASGTYSVLLELTDSANYCWPNSGSTLYSVPFTIKSKEEAELKEIFDNQPVELESDVNGGWIVTLTNDITGPVEIYGNLGAITIDLNGYDITGTDGEPAIRIVLGDGDGSVTRLSLVTGGGDSVVQGGANSPAIVVSEGVAGIIVNIGKGVTVCAGSEDVPAISGGEIGESEGSLVKVKVPVPVLPELEYTGVPQVPALPVTDIYTVSVSSGINPGTYPIMATLIHPSTYEWISRDGVTVNGATAIFTFTILNPPPSINIEGGLTQGEGSGASVKAVYNGRGHGIEVKVVNPLSGATVRYATSPSGPFMYEKPLYTNAVHGAETWFEISAEGFAPVTNMATVTVEAKLLTQSMVGVKSLKENEKGEVVPVIELSDTPPCVILKDDWSLVSWEPRASGGGKAVVRGCGNYTGTLTIDVPNEMTVVFDAVYGSSGDVRTVTTQIPGSSYVLPPTAPVYRGHDFLGWFTERDGGEEVTASRVVSLSDHDVVYAHWRVSTSRITFELNGGTGNAPAFDASFGSAFAELPSVSKPGYIFDGWWTTPNFEKGTKVEVGDPYPVFDTTLYVKWLRRALWYSDSIIHLEDAAVYDGYLIDTEAGDVVSGTIQVKAAKPNKKTGSSKIAVSIVIPGKKKITIKGETFDGSLKVKAKDGRELDIVLGQSALAGTFDRYAVDGTRNIFSAKDEDSKVKVAQAMKSWQGTYTLAWEGKSGWNGLSLVIGTKGKTKVSGSLSDGTKVSVTTQLLIGERENAVVVSWKKKNASVSFLMWFCEDGTVECSNLEGGAHAVVANIKSGAYLSEGSVFTIDSEWLGSLIPGICQDILPNGQPVRMKKGKFDVDKAGKVKLLKDKSGLDMSKAGTNPSGLKLTYKIKDGTFKGSFYVYTIINSKLKKYTATVTGIVLGGKGYGTATIKKFGSWPIVIEPSKDF